MSNKPIVPMFRAEAPDHSSDEIKVPFIVNGHIEFITDENVCMVDREGGCWCCQLNTLQMSLNNGTTWAYMEEVSEALDLLSQRKHDEETMFNSLPPNI
jgi:hypothetical protein